MQISVCIHAGIAQLVERNLAKVEVESSSLFSRSRCKKGKLLLPFFVTGFGAIANRLCNGLQIRLAQFDSGSRLQHKQTKPHYQFGSVVFLFVASVGNL